MTGSASKNRNGSVAEIREGEPVVGLDVACDKASRCSEGSRAGESEYSSTEGTGRIELRFKELEEALSLSELAPTSYSSIFITGMSSSGSFFLNENIVIDQKILKQKKRDYMQRLLYYYILKGLTDV